jgi:hypothetical protein
VNGVWPFEGRSWCGNEGYEVRGPVYGPAPVWTTRQIESSYREEDLLSDRVRRGPMECDRRRPLSERV